MLKFELQTAEIVVQYEIDAAMLRSIEQILIKLAGLIISYNIGTDLIF